MSLTLDAAASRLELWTYKEGLLSGVAHDLCFRAEGWTLTLDDGDGLTVRAVIPVSCLTLAGQVKHHHVTPMKPKDAADIRKNLTGDRVLDAGRHPEIRFEGRGVPSAPSMRLEGELSLRGTTRPLVLETGWEPTADGVVARGEVRFAPSQWGIAPFTALLGALRVRDEVRLSWELHLRRA